MKNYQISPLTFFIMSQSVQGVKASLLPCLTSVPVSAHTSDDDDTGTDEVFLDPLHAHSMLSEVDCEALLPSARPNLSTGVFDEPEDLEVDDKLPVIRPRKKPVASTPAPSPISGEVSDPLRGESLAPEDRIVQLSKQLFIKHAEQALGLGDGKKVAFSGDVCAPNHLFTTPPRYRMKDVKFHAWADLAKKEKNVSKSDPKSDKDHKPDKKDLDKKDPGQDHIRFISLSLDEVAGYLKAMSPHSSTTPDAISLEFDGLAWDDALVPLILKLKDTGSDIWLKIKHPSVWESIDETVLHKSVQVGWSWWCDMHGHADVLWAHLNASKPHWRFWLLHHKSNQWVWPWCDILAAHLARKLNTPTERYWVVDHRQKTVWSKIEEDATRSMETILGGSGMTGALFLHVLQTTPPPSE